MSSAEHTADHAASPAPSALGKLFLAALTYGCFRLVDSMIASKTIPLPSWAVMLICASVGIVIAGGSTVVADERGGRLATYLGFVIAFTGILLMINGWIFHAAGK
jgi:hypothetical protein